MRYFWQMCLLREVPQTLPRSIELFWLLLGVNVLVGMAQLWGAKGPVANIIVQLVAAYIIEFGLIWLLFYLIGRAARYLQIVTALLGSDTILGLIVVMALVILPVLNAVDVFGFLYLGIVIWSLVITGHILRHGMEIPLVGGIVIAVSIFLIRISVLLTLLGTNE